MTKEYGLPGLTDSQQSRHAGAAVSGYLYQFERSIVEILNLPPGGSARVEGIEDVDLWSAEGPRAIQIKHHEAKAWSLAEVRKPVLEMLKSYSAGVHVDYVLYVYFGSGEKPPGKLTLAQLKECLTYRPRKKKGEDESNPIFYHEKFERTELEDFLDSFTIQSGTSLSAQKTETITAIANALGSSREDAEILHRARAVHFLEEVAVRKNEIDRHVSREDLLEFLDIQDSLYSRWHQELVKRTRLFTELRKRLREERFSEPSRDRGILTKIDETNIGDVVELASMLASDYTGPNKRRTTSAMPWTLILRGNNELVRRAKSEIIKKEVPLNDGYENIEFSTTMFRAPAVINTKGRSQILDTASYALRVISENTLKDLANTDFKINRLLTLDCYEPWHKNIVARSPVKVYGLDAYELSIIIEEVTR